MFIKIYVHFNYITICRSIDQLLKDSKTLSFTLSTKNWSQILTKPPLQKTKNHACSFLIQHSDQQVYIFEIFFKQWNKFNYLPSAEHWPSRLDSFGSRLNKMFFAPACIYFLLCLNSVVWLECPHHFEGEIHFVYKMDMKTNSPCFQHCFSFIKKNRIQNAKSAHWNLNLSMT